MSRKSGREDSVYVALLTIMAVMIIDALQWPDADIVPRLLLALIVGMIVGMFYAKEK